MLFTAGAHVQLNTVRVRLEIRDPSLEVWDLEIAAPRGGRLLPGMYEGAVRFVARAVATNAVAIRVRIISIFLVFA